MGVVLWDTKVTEEFWEAVDKHQSNFAKMKEKYPTAKTYTIRRDGKSAGFQVKEMRLGQDSGKVLAMVNITPKGPAEKQGLEYYYEYQILAVCGEAVQSLSKYTKVMKRCKKTS